MRKTQLFGTFKTAGTTTKGKTFAVRHLRKCLAMEFVVSVGGRCGCGSVCGAGRSDGRGAGQAEPLCSPPGHDAAAISIRLATCVWQHAV